MGSKKILPFNSFLFGTPGIAPTYQPTGQAVTGANTYLSPISYQNAGYVYNMDNFGIELTWTGTPTGTFTVLGSNSGFYFYPLSFPIPLAQPSGSAGGFLININQFPWQYIQIQYVNSSGSGTIIAALSGKDLN